MKNNLVTEVKKVQQIDSANERS